MVRAVRDQVVNMLPLRLGPVHLLFVALQLKWDDRSLRRAYDFRPSYPQTEQEGKEITV